MSHTVRDSCMTFLSDVIDYVDQYLRSTIYDSYVTQYNFREWFYDMIMTIVTHRYIVCEWYDCHNHIIISSYHMIVMIISSYHSRTKSVTPMWLIYVVREWYEISSYHIIHERKVFLACCLRVCHVCDMPHSYVWHASFICVTCLIHMCDMPHSYVWHALFICVTCLIHMCDMPHSYVWHEGCTCVWHASSICVTCLIHMCDCSRVKRQNQMDSYIFICVPYRHNPAPPTNQSHMCNTYCNTHCNTLQHAATAPQHSWAPPTRQSHVWVTWLFLRVTYRHSRALECSQAPFPSRFTCVTIHTCEYMCATWLLPRETTIDIAILEPLSSLRTPLPSGFMCMIRKFMCMNRKFMCMNRKFMCMNRKFMCPSSVKIHVYDTGWRRCIGCLKLQVSFHKRATNYRALLRKMTYEVRHPTHLRHPVRSPSSVKIHVYDTTHSHVQHDFFRAKRRIHMDSYVWHTTIIEPVSALEPLFPSCSCVWRESIHVYDMTPSVWNEKRQIHTCDIPP